MLGVIASACHPDPTVRKILATRWPASENRAPFHDIFGATGAIVIRLLGPQGPQLKHLGLHLQGRLDSLSPIACHFDTTVWNFLLIAWPARRPACLLRTFRRHRVICNTASGPTGFPIGSLWASSARRGERVEHDRFGLPSGSHRQKNFGHWIASVRKPSALSRHFWRHRGPCHTVAGPTRSSIEALGASSAGQA